VILDVAVLAVLATAALLGASGGALRQVVQLAAAVLGWLAARHLGPAVAEGFARSVPALLARAGASALLFVGTFALASLLGGAALRMTGLARIVRGPADRGLGALLGGAKGALGAWVLLSALALVAGSPLGGGLAARTRGSDFAGLARRHNLLVRLDPERARALERVLRAARAAEAAGRLAPDADARRLLSDPRLRGFAERGDPVDEAEAARILEDPEVRALVERLRVRADGGDAVR
jgi:membrane protein required for colicin V production